jgi:asparagine synthetase B (glutamine-hydrolysing)
LPAELKVRRLEGKHLVRRVARDLLPPEVLSRRKVAFFNAAVDDWLRANADQAARRYLLDPSARSQEFLDRRELDRLLTAYERKEKGAPEPAFVLALLMLEAWLTTVPSRATQLHAAAATVVDAPP